jgi:hypothetical protein
MTDTKAHQTNRTPPLNRLETDLAGLKPAALSPELKARIRAEVTASLAPKKQRSRFQRAALATTLGLLLMFGLALIQSRNHSTTPAKLGLAALWFAVVCFTQWRTMASFRPAERTLRQGMLGLGVLSFFGYLFLLSDATLPWTDFLTLPASRHAAAACTALSVTIGSLCLVGTLFLWRRTDPFSPKLSGLIAGLAAGIMGASAAELMCPVKETWHLMIAHGAVIGLLSGAGYWLGRRFLSP